MVLVGGNQAPDLPKEAEMDRYEFLKTLPFKYGSKLDTKLSTTEEAKLIRADIKEAVKTGLLPKAKYSVRTKYFSGGSSIDVRISDVKTPIINLDWIERVMTEAHWQYNTPACMKYTDTGRSILWTVEAIVNQYNFDKSEPMVDYFFVNFYSSVEYNWQWERSITESLKTAYTG
ncbi:MAG: hypothetical protein NUV65_06885 [Candidatus Roizmanbacteria bacterium]|nr:hypothetical protein [Candidatus Roizmanbacteria bacterium]